MIDAGEAEGPGIGEEFVTTAEDKEIEFILWHNALRALLYDLISHNKVIDVDQEPWNVTQKEHNDNCWKDE